MTYLLDTNVVSELRRTTPDSAVRRWFASVPGGELYLSALVVGELRQGIERLRRRDGPQAELLAGWLETLKREFQGRILPVTIAVAEKWGELNKGRPLPVVDGLLAATALVHGLTLVTREIRSLHDVEVALLNPWEATV